MRNSMLALATVGLLAGAASAQWAEVGDAPDGPFARQDTVGSGPLNMITGAFDSIAGDHVDTYSIIITDPSIFYATTSDNLDPAAFAIDTSSGFDDDTRLYLWDENGNIMLGNDDDNPGLQSSITDPSTFVAFTGGVVDPTASGISLVAGQKYLLSITYYSNEPRDAAGTLLADLGSDFDALHGPNPNAGAFAAWDNDETTDDTTYGIALQGATYCMDIPAPGALALLGVAGVAGTRRRRRA